MTDKPTPEQIQRACDLLGRYWTPKAYGRESSGCLTTLADTIAQLDAMQAERDKATADLGEISRLLDQPMVNSARAIAAPYRVETDPLVEALRTIVPIIHCEGDETAAEAVARQLRSDPRWLEIGRSA